jgi:hypothetical protein
MNKKLYSGGKTSTKTPQRVKALFAERRAIAERMIDSANEILNAKRNHSRLAVNDAYREKQQGIALLATCLF